jgi:hypothetical protein
MGSTVSIVLPDKVYFTDLLKLSPALVGERHGWIVNTEALEALFKASKYSNFEVFCVR